MRAVSLIAFALFVLFAGTAPPAFAQGFRTDGPLLEPEHQTIEELRALRRQDSRPADQRQHDVRVATAAGVGAVAAIFAVLYWRRRRHAAADGPLLEPEHRTLDEIRGR